MPNAILNGMQMSLSIATFAVGGLGGYLVDALSDMIDLGSLVELGDLLKTCVENTVPGIKELALPGVKELVKALGKAVEEKKDVGIDLLAEFLAEKFAGNPEDLLKKWSEAKLDLQ